MATALCGYDYDYGDEMCNSAIDDFAEPDRTSFHLPLDKNPPNWYICSMNRCSRGGSMTQLSQKRRQILDFIHEFMEEKGYAPTVRDIMRGCNISSTAAVQHHLSILEREGYISRDPEVSRSITIGERGRRTVKVPILGYIAAGEPIPVPQSDTWSHDFLEALELSYELMDVKNNVYALIVRGMSMIDALIDEGDIVVMQATNTVEDGEMAAVWLKKEQEVTLKKVYREPGCIRLQPANSQMEPVYHDPENVEIQGRVIGVIRSLVRLS
jgi:repressor LexA